MLPSVRAVVLGQFNPLRLGSDLLAYWDARRTDLITISTGVSSWKDITHGYAATQGTGSAQPTYSATSFGGDPGLTFDGVDDCLTSTDAGLLAALPASASHCELWLLCQQDALVADGSQRHFLNYGNGNGNPSRAIVRIAQGGQNCAEGITGSGAASGVAINTTVNFSTRHALRWEVAASASQLTVDGTAPVSVSVTPSTTASRLRLGANSAATAANFAQGVIAVAMVTLPLSDSKTAALQSWLMSRRRV